MVDRITVSKTYITNQVDKWYKLDSYKLKWALAKWEAISIFGDGVHELIDRLMVNWVGINCYTKEKIIENLNQEFEGESYDSWNDFVDHVEEEFK